MSVPDGLLVLLTAGPKHGYQLATDFGERTAGVWSLNTGQVYTTLDRLARDGFVEPDGTDPGDSRRRLWRLTDEGRDRAETWLDDIAPPAGARDETVLRVLLVAAVDPGTALRVVDAQRRALVTRLQQLRRAQRGTGDDLIGRLAADAAAVRVESDLRWLDLAEERLRRASSAPTPPSQPPAAPTHPSPEARP